MLNNQQWQNEIDGLVEIIAKAPLEKTTKWGSDVYTFNGKNVLSYGAFKDFFSIWFFNGVFLIDKYGVLVSANEGKTKSLRQWRFTNINQIDEKKILEYITEAIEVEKKGLKIKPDQFLPVPVPEILEKILNKDEELNERFSNLTPGRQKEYSLYLMEAKQENTRQNRLEKILPMIKRGEGLNDKYK